MENKSSKNAWSVAYSGMTLFIFIVVLCLKRAILNSLPDPPDPADQVSETAARTYLPHAPGVRMTVVKQTPSNYRAFMDMIAIYILGIIKEVYFNMYIIHLETSTETSQKYRSPTFRT